ncbi:MAG: nucleoside diphosphate kinase regulator [Verrucomicrobiae bacterium]|nr:nucleoside diphosphate kinase regulator [Verrucomicrobiae bacterium]
MDDEEGCSLKIELIRGFGSICVLRSRALRLKNPCSLDFSSNSRHFIPFTQRNLIVSHRNIFITEFDKTRLMELLGVAGDFGRRDRKDLDALAEEMKKAQIVSSKEIPPDTVTMNSKVVLRDMETNEKMTYVLVFPKDADIDTGRISVLAPVGTSILGYAKGDVVEWTVPSGIRRLRIEKVLYQPEAAGDFHL